MAPVPLGELTKKRGTAKGKITRTVNSINALEAGERTRGKLSVLKEQLSAAWKEYNSVHDEILLKCEEEDSGDHWTDYNAEFDKYGDAMAQLNEWLEDATRPSTPATSSTPTATQSITSAKPRLPKLELPTFSGNFEDWISFVNLFESDVHNNPDLTGSQKLQYLKGCLKGSAANLISYMKVTDSNYDEAWKLLRKRYQHEREIINAHLRKLWHQPKCQGSVESLRRLIDTTNECVKSLSVLGESIDTWNSILNFIVTEKLDDETNMEWEKTLMDDKIPKHADFMDFLERRSRALATKGQPQRTSGPHSSHNRSSITSNKTKTCCIDGSDHPVSRCTTFIKASDDEKMKLVKKHQLCENCLGAGHAKKDCTSGNCRKCNKRHHSLLHDYFANQSRTTLTAHTLTTRFENLMPTAIVRVRDSNGKIQKIRALLDEASDDNHLNEECAKRLQLESQPEETIVKAIGGVTATQGKARSNLKIVLDNNKEEVIDALVIPQVTDCLPTTEIRHHNWEHIKNLKLADPNFYRPQPIDLILGVAAVARFRREGLRQGWDKVPAAQDTAFGWVLFGQTDQVRESETTFTHFTTDQLLRKFWEIEQLPSEKILTEEEKACEEYFRETTTRDQGGRYTVCLPFKEDKALGESREIAVRRFLSLERKFERSSNFEKAYKLAMQDYFDQGHIEPIPPDEISRSNATYLPHHAVIRNDHATTKLRIVFDASAATSNGRSLNDILMKGPKVQDDLFDILIRFRVHVIAITADIEKMYRQINISPENRDYQRIIWRNRPTEPLQDYRLITVTFGEKPAPYLATKTLQQLADDEEHKLPMAAEVTKKDFYVDDLMSGERTVTRATELVNQLDQLTSAGGFALRKWASNSEEVIKTIPVEKRATNAPLSIDSDQVVKTLGLQWHPAHDYFTFSVNFPSRDKITKRTIASDIFRIFDPMGWLAPVTIRGKILIQSLWKASIDWDAEVPENLNKQWKEYAQALPELEKIKIQRRIVADEVKQLSLCGFSDASEKALGAVVYLRTERPDGVIEVKLIAAKTKVAPINPLTIPRLELCAAVLLANLLKAISRVLQVENVNAWTDSTDVLHWIQSEPGRWKAFVAHRVAEIQNLFPKDIWHKVDGINNPADCASRGLNPSVLQNFELWWDGPTFLQNKNCTEDNTAPLSPSPEAAKETRPAVSQSHVTITNSLKPLISEKSSFRKLIRVTAFVQRFIKNCRSKTKTTGPLTVMELEKATDYWIKVSQGNDFSQEIEQLKTKGKLEGKNQIINLAPFLDSKGILRVGGRLKNSALPENAKHPILLSSKNWICKLIIKQVHLDQFHAGQQLMKTLLRRKYWIIGLRDELKRQVNKCIICYRMKAEVGQQLMADLPAVRVNPGRPFLRTGVDYAGPFLIKSMAPRSKTTTKAYVSLFVCFATRAIHLELVSNATTEAFIAALRRFVARRGCPKDMFSDCGKNFEGADNELSKLLKQLNYQQISDELSSKGIQWNFNPPKAPHFGGLWEAGVKSFKYHFIRIIKNTRLNFEEMTTVITQIEAVLNSRPLTEISSDPEDFTPLTPGHFLIGDALTAPPDPDLTEINTNRLNRWQLIQALTQHFWKRWSSEYLTRLQQRPKWTTPKPNFEIGELVVIKDTDLPPLRWKLGRITAVHPGKDGLVRVVTVKTKKKEKKRPISKICHLPLDKDS